MVVRVAEAAQANAIICATETEKFTQYLHELSERINLIAATTNRETYDGLIQGGLEARQLLLRAIDKYSQVRHIISVVLKAKSVYSKTCLPYL